MPKIEGTERIDPFRIKVPKGFVPGMKTEGIIYLDETLEEELEIEAVRQVANVATLPGIVGKSLAMPDIHTGYGFPIGGVAAFDIEEGVISPGGVGYDINCLAPGTKVLSYNGYSIEIEKLMERILEERLLIFDENAKSAASSNLNLFSSRKIDSNEKIIRITTELGKVIEGSQDHPVFTDKGYVDLGMIVENDFVLIYPFEGVEYEEKEGILLEERDFLEEDGQIIEDLKERKLLPLYWNSPQLGIIAKIIGFAMGNRHLRFMKGKSVLTFYGNEESLMEIKRDLEILRIKSNIYASKRKYKIESLSGLYDDLSVSSELRIPSIAFVYLLKKLGLPIGNKTEMSFRVPKWIIDAPRWIKRNFIAGVFGAAGSILNFKGYKPLPINLTQVKKRNCEASLNEFLQDIKLLLKEFDIESIIYEIRAKEGIIKRLSIVGEKNIRNFLSRINYEYSARKKERGLFCYAYLLQKASVKKIIAEEAKLASEIHSQQRSIASAFVSFVNRTFVEKPIYDSRQERRLPIDFPTLDDFIKEHGLAGGFVFDRVVKVERIKPAYNNLYDIGVIHDAHNFIANGIVVHNCGVRLLRSNLTRDDVEPKIRELVDLLYTHIPSGVGSTGKIKLSPQDEKEVVRKGAIWAVENGYGEPDDLQKIESHGCLEDADPSVISQKAYERGRAQQGTLGSGNHFLEVQYVAEVYEPEIADVMGLFKGQITVMIHSGSRGFGHQICDDYVRVMLNAAKKYGIELPDKELACAPFKSKEGQDYYRAMCGAANYAWANRQCLMHWTREVFLRLFKLSPRDLGMKVIFDVAHNIAKVEFHLINGKKTRLVVHRKGATRAFPKGHPELPEIYKNIGQPVLIPGDMGRVSYVLVGTEKGMEETFGSTCHGAGRVLSRNQAIKQARGRSIKQELAERGIVVRSAGKETLAEEMPDAYKDVSNVVEVVHNAGIAKKVIKLKPMGVIKG